MTPSGKIPSTDDPRIGPAWGETASLLSNFIPLGGPMTGVGAMAIPMAAKVARRAALSMDTAARMARAAEMGFVTDLPLYQGTDRAFSAFDLSKGGAMTGGSTSTTRGMGLFLTRRSRGNSRPCPINEQLLPLRYILSFIGRRRRATGNYAEMRRTRRSLRHWLKPGMMVSTL
jgi:hypothetical protein